MLPMTMTKNRKNRAATGISSMKIFDKGLKK